MRSLNTNTNSTTAANRQTTTSTPRDASPTRSNLSKTTRKPISADKDTPSQAAATRQSSATKLRVTPRIASSNKTITTSTSSDPSVPVRVRRQPILSTSIRAPLRAKDQNAMRQQLSSPLTGNKPKTANMPPPHDNKGGNGTPRQPALSAAAAKAMGRPPLTPKVASKSQQPTVTPLARRRTETGNTPRDEVASPGPGLLANNVTPRSGTRQNRVDSANSTPTGTPNPDRTNDWDTRSGFDGDGGRKHHVVTFSPHSDAGIKHDNPDAKFFYASDAKGSQQGHHAQQSRPSQPQRGSTFMYANAIDRNRPTSPGVSPGFTPMLAQSAKEPQASKFFHANGTPDLQPPFRPSSSATSAQGSTVSTNSKMAIGRTSASTPSGVRPGSPNKQPQQPITQAPKGSSPSLQLQQQTARPQLTSPPSLAPQPGSKRRVSLENSPQPSGHSRAGSMSPGDAMIMSRFMNSHHTSQPSSEASSPAASAVPPNPAMTMASIIQAAEDLPAESDDSKGGTGGAHSEVQSPTKSHAGDPLNDLVASARRERKVQDLEIRNASLEAINRSLERQLRKQTTELRRYRRLSRSGRLSLASVASSRVVSDSTVGMSADGSELGLSDLSEEDEDEEPEEDNDSLYDTDPSSDPESATGSGMGSADRRRKRDERRLQLDLTKHRELLVDSQKINQSIKRCMGWTEELISEGKKALEYHVRVSDVEAELPPRVLAPQYEDENDDTSRFEDEDDTSRLEDNLDVHVDAPQSATNAGAEGLSEIRLATGNGSSSGSSNKQPPPPLRGPGIESSSGTPTQPSTSSTPVTTMQTQHIPVEGPRLAPPWGKAAQDRDSGVELPSDGG